VSLEGVIPLVILIVLMVGVPVVSHLWRARRATAGHAEHRTDHVSADNKSHHRHGCC